MHRIEMIEDATVLEGLQGVSLDHERGDGEIIAFRSQICEGLGHIREKGGHELPFGTVMPDIDVHGLRDLRLLYADDVQEILHEGAAQSGAQQFLCDVILAEGLAGLLEAVCDAR